MESPQLTKQECTRLSIFSAALAVGTYCGVVGTAGVGVPVAMVGTVLASVAGGIVTNEVSAISNRLGKDTVGKAIAKVIVAVADSKRLPKATETDLRKMAKLAENKWENLVENLPGEFAPLQASQLTDFFANCPEDFSNLTALDIGLWVALLDDLRWKAGVILAQPVITYTANCLYEFFPKALREVLIEDFKSDGKAFAGMVLDLFGVMRSQISENHELIYQRLNAISGDFNLDEFEQRLELLSQKSQDEIAAELRSVAGQIDSGFQDVLQQMEVLSKQCQQRDEELGRQIAYSTDIQTRRTNFWHFLVDKKDESRPNWLQFFTEEEMVNLKIVKRQTPPHSVQKITPKIPANKSLWMVIDWGLTNYQLLLFNRSEQDLCLLCPSSGYAPNSIMKESRIWLPLKNSWADENKSNFEFDTGKEEFLAVALEKPLSLPWLTPRPTEELPELNAERINELSEQLRQQDNWHIFYKSFQVVEQ